MKIKELQEKYIVLRSTTHLGLEIYGKIEGKLIGYIEPEDMPKTEDDDIKITPLTPSNL